VTEPKELYSEEKKKRWIIIIKAKNSVVCNQQKGIKRIQQKLKNQKKPPTIGKTHNVPKG
jgi:hypothetical protein